VVKFTLRRFYPREKALGTLGIGGWLGPTAGLDVLRKGKSFFLQVFKPQIVFT
jgi:hypothetical protein